MIDKSDWRLQGQERYLKGVILIHRKYRRYAKNPHWNHDHCEFCWATFMTEEYPDVLHIGYATEDDYRWICEICFQDFKEMFGWTVIDKLE
jgi:hypothetical protein